jgi:hypothetical protein
MSKTILYLDYDGVLHPEPVYRHPRVECTSVSTMLAIACSRTRSSLSKPWRHTRSRHRLVYLLGPRVELFPGQGFSP